MSSARRHSVRHVITNVPHLCLRTQILTTCTRVGRARGALSVRACVVASVPLPVHGHLCVGVSVSAGEAVGPWAGVRLMGRWMMGVILE